MRRRRKIPVTINPEGVAALGLILASVCAVAALIALAIRALA